MSDVFSTHRDQILALARSLVVSGALHHASKEKVDLPFTPETMRLLGRALEAMVDFSDHQSADHTSAITARDEALRTLGRAQAEFRKSLILSCASMAWCVLSFVWWWTA